MYFVYQLAYIREAGLQLLSAVFQPYLHSALRYDLVDMEVQALLTVQIIHYI